MVAGCREFAADFDRKKENLLFTGSTGVGKTFLTNCIAKELIDSGHSVIYLSAGDLFEAVSYTHLNMLFSIPKNSTMESWQDR